MAHILVVDDDPGVRFTLETTLRDAGHEVSGVESAEAGLSKLASLRDGAVDVIISDVRMPGIDGLAFLDKVRAQHPALPVVVVTAHGDERTAVDAMKRGAWDYVKKPFHVDELTLVVETIVERLRLQTENNALIAERALSRPIIFRSKPMARLMDLVHRAAQRDVTVLITGETGTGKELVAAALHELSPRGRAGAPFVAVNVASLPSGTAESELFGHERGAFTGAVRAHRGLFEQAHGGTLFLDEIGELSLELQAKLLRVLQEGRITRMGAEGETAVDVRVVAATNRDLREDVKAKRLREDLFYRLYVVELRVPALSERPDDISALVGHFVAKHAARFELAPLQVAPGVVAALGARPWPGNVRELEHAVERLVSLCDGERITDDDLALVGDPTGAGGAAAGAAGGGGGGDSLRDRVEAFERNLIREALESAQGNQSKAARTLKMSRVTLLDKIRKYGL